MNPTKATEIYWVRHGEIQSNIEKIYAGWGDEPLTEEGSRQAHRLGESLKGSTSLIGKIYSSPIRRAMQTAAILSEHTGAALLTDARLTEMRMGAWEGLSEEAISHQFPEDWQLWQNSPADLQIPGRETLDQIADRISTFIEFVRGEGDSLVLAVTHYAVIRIAQLLYRRQSLNLYKSITVPNCQLIGLKYE